jgi:hypothetical protein
MATNGRPFRTCYWLWAVAACCVLVSLGFVDPTAGVSKGEHSFWSLFVALAPRGEVIPLVISASILTGAAALLGWVLHAFGVILWRVAVRRRDACEGVTTSVAEARE